MTDRYHSRRRVLQGLGACTVAAVAGCSGSDSAADGTDTHDGTDGGDETPGSDGGSGTDDSAASGAEPTTHTAKLAADDTGEDAALGYAVAADGDTVLVGAPRVSPDDVMSTGAAYVFERGSDGWTRTAKLTPDADQAVTFGGAVALDGDTAFIGDPNDPGPGGDESSVGTMYVYNRGADGWSEVNRLYADDGDARDRFGHAVALAGDTALVGAVNDDDPNGEVADLRRGGSGSAYLFERVEGSWEQVSKLAPQDGEPGDRFGSAVALTDGVALIGAPRAPEVDGGNGGSAYVFERTDGEWHQRTELDSGDDAGDQRFGAALALSSGTVLVSAPSADWPNGTIEGAVYAYERTDGEWSSQEKFAPVSGETTDEFGSRIAFHGETALVTAPDEDVSGVQLVGAAYLFERSGGAWTQRDRLVAGDAQKQDDFGDAAALTDGRALVGAPDNDTRDGEDTGSVYVFDL